MQMPQATTSTEALERLQKDFPSASTSNHSSTTLQSYTSTSAQSSNTNHLMDPSFNPPFPNDVRITTRPWKQSLMHFAQKHKDDGLFYASMRHWKAHFEFGSCLLDARRLKMRYERLRALDPAYLGATAKPLPSTTAPRVKFIQFYTACYKGRAGQELAKNVQNSTLESRASSFSASPSTRAEGDSGHPSPVPLPAEKDQLFFCKLKYKEGGQVDPQWRKVMMMTNDEIVAHTVLFKPGPHYESLVEQVSTEMTMWITEAFPSA